MKIKFTGRCNLNGSFSKSLTSCGKRYNKQTSLKKLRGGSGGIEYR